MHNTFYLPCLSEYVYYNSIQLLDCWLKLYPTWCAEHVPYSILHVNLNWSIDPSMKCITRETGGKSCHYTTATSQRQCRTHGYSTHCGTDSHQAQPVGSNFSAQSWNMLKHTDGYWWCNYDNYGGNLPVIPWAWYLLAVWRSSKWMACVWGNRSKPIYQYQTQMANLSQTARIRIQCF